MAVDGVAARAAEVIAGLADEPVPLPERARRILQELQPVLGYDAASIALRDPERQSRIPLASAGDACPLHAYWASAGADAELARLGLNRPGPPLLSSELSPTAAETVYWRGYLEPAGFHCGIDAALFTADGGQVGHLTVLNKSDARPGAGTPVIAEVVERLDGGDLYATFLHPVPDAGAGALLRVTALDCRDDIADHLRAAVLLSGEPELRGLSRHDLQVLGLIVAGWEDDRRIAAALDITPEDVAATIRRGMQLLGVRSRTGLAVRALRDGLFLLPRNSGANG